MGWAEMRLILARLLFDFDLRTVTDSDGKEQLPHWEDQKTYALWTRQAYFLEVRPRNH